MLPYLEYLTFDKERDGTSITERLCARTGLFGVLFGDR